MGLSDLYYETFEQEEIEKVAEVNEEEAFEKVASDYVTAGRFIARGYSDEMEKIASKSKILKTLRKVAPYAAGYGAVTGAAGALMSTKGAKERLEGTAKGSAQNIAAAKKTRKRSGASYLLNPAAHGPLSELGHRITRRTAAAAKEHPYKSAMIPFYSLAKGGKTGEDIMNKED